MFILLDFLYFFMSSCDKPHVFHKQSKNSLWIKVEKNWSSPIFFHSCVRKPLPVVMIFYTQKMYYLSYYFRHLTKKKSTPEIYMYKKWEGKKRWENLRKKEKRRVTDAILVVYMLMLLVLFTRIGMKNWVMCIMSFYVVAMHNQLNRLTGIFEEI